ncbi:DNA repair protein RadC [Rosenbergiella australiborealis]|uniref:DNA repair protein RadC n=1 Tax=Rosenbergiella australiborealis TaxID=1544696 RepID=A0ABS5T501_9GAMM|nr:DNA repair protein RadC [Rosenbergiella australiborealis]MBT0727421.1 DNA repair protein RadC [Rosenbergiella australiborealis]
MDEKPREKLLTKGAAALTDSELLAIFLRTGNPEMPVMEFARHLLSHFGSLNAVMSATQEQYSTVKGIGQSKLCQIYAIAELGKRFYQEKLLCQETISDPAEAYHYLTTQLAHLEREVFQVIFLDNRHRVLQAKIMFQGTINSVEVHPREIVKEALSQNAAAMILAHNHPSGISEPSAADKNITQRIQKACRLFDISVLDHFVIGKGEFFSFAQRGWL